MKTSVKNFFDLHSGKLSEELIETLAQSAHVKIERIVSEGQASPENFWYDQENDEFVILLEGEAVLKFENGETAELKEGDYIIIPAHVKHRVEKTSTQGKTFWLAVHFNNK